MKRIRPTTAPTLLGVSSGIEDAVGQLQKNRSVTAVRHFPAREAHCSPFPEFIDPRLVDALGRIGIGSLYSHQAEAAKLTRQGKDVVVVTPTASGKTLCYNLPIFQALLENSETRALYLFPTKALSQDQLAEINRLRDALKADIRAFTYDGDTPQDARKSIRSRGNLVITNPDMLHSGVLPHHPKWAQFFENLRYVVIDELHSYRGVFGSHLGNVLRRLSRIAAFYGSRLQFICSSATIANPAELAGQILEREVVLVDENGAPSGEKHFLFYNPPVVNAKLGIRRSYLNETRRLAQVFLGRGLQSIIFANSRLRAEILAKYLKEDFAGSPASDDTIRAYRGGYLPRERREIERRLREGKILGVVSTNALELGVDIGSLDAAILAGYPGTIASTWQRAGRAGRRRSASAALLVASSAPLDQFIVQHPDYFFGRSPEHGYVNPDNLQILLDHVKCAAFELPLREKERFGRWDMKPLCRFLEESGFLHATADGWHWTSESYPADAISLRSISSDNFVIVDEEGGPRIIGEVDFTSALTTLHEKAIYLQDGEQYQVERLDYDGRKAYVKPCNSDYYTDAISYTKVKPLETFAQEPLEAGAKSHGEVQVNTQVVGFKKIKFYTMENVGSGELSLPEQEMHTTAYWLTLSRELLASLPFSASEGTYGVIGLSNALHAMATLLVMCDARDLGATVEENPRGAEGIGSMPQGLNSDENGDEDSASRAGSSAASARLKTFFEPNIYLYDCFPGGVGLSEPLFRLHDELLNHTWKLIADCPCEEGCPSCVGPVGEVGEKGKQVALEILKHIRAEPAE